MRILHINTGDLGGAAIAAIRLHMALRDQDVESSMLLLKKIRINIPSTYTYLEPRLQRRGFLLRQLLRFRNIISPPQSQQDKNWQKLQGRVSGFEAFSFSPTDYDITSQKVYKEADIIHLHWIADFFDFKNFKIIDKPIIWTLHDMNPFTGGCHYSGDCEKYKYECSECPQLEGTINQNNSLANLNYKKKFLREVSPIISSPSVWLSNCSSNSALFGGLKTLVIPYSLDVNVFKKLDKTFSRQTLNLPNDKKILLFVSDSIENRRKGFDLLLGALEELDHPDIHICAIGNKCQLNELKFQISFLDRIFDERLMALAYSAADVFILPSREDNLPNVMLESLACGTPVITFPIGGMPDVIKTGYNGILADNVTSGSLAKAINEFFKEKFEFNRDEISKDARKNYAPEIQANRYISIYQEILKFKQTGEA